jgi:predicted nucleotidyltransferase component of viral defense system
VKRETPKNLAASVRQRLLNLAQTRGEDFGLVLTRYGIERFLYRLAQSEYHDQFVLKGALLFELWTQRPYRPTRDLDLEGRGENSTARTKRLFSEIMNQVVEDDGLVFDPKSLRVARIKEDQEYEGLRVTLVSRLERARIHMQIDIGFGDVIVPAPNEIQYPAMLNFPSARLRAYPREAVVAEKLEALVKLGMANTRMKDFYDLWKLSHDFDFEGALLADAIKATFTRRGTEVPSRAPLALTEEFSHDSQKAKQWQAFLKKSGLDHDHAELHTVAAQLATFLLPPLQAATAAQPFTLTWHHGGPWASPQA